MKKGLFGYSAKQVDDYINLLQDKNDALTAKMAKLTLQLTAAENAVDNSDSINLLEAKVAQLESTIADMKKQEEKYDAANNELNNRNILLKQENEKLARDIQQLQETPSNTDVSSKIGNIFGKAYSEAVHLQQSVTDEMKTRVDLYAKTIAQSNLQMRQAVNATRQSYDEMINGMVSQLDKIFSDLSMIESGTHEIEKTMLLPETIVQDMKRKIDDAAQQNLRSLSSVNAANKNFDEEESHSYNEPVVEKEDVVVSPIQQLKDKYFKSTCNGQIVSVYTNVSKDDIFYGKNKEAF